MVIMRFHVKMPINNHMFLKCYNGILCWCMYFIHKFLKTSILFIVNEMILGFDIVYISFVYLKGCMLGVCMISY